MENVGILNGHLVYFAAIYVVYYLAIWSILRPFSILFGHLVLFYGYLVYFSRFGMLCKEKSGNPDRWSESSNQRQKELYVQCHKISIRNTFLQNSSLVLDRVWLGWPDWVTWDSFLKITEVAHMFGPQFPMIKVFKNGWAKFGQFFSQTHLVTLIWTHRIDM
jgi:hypothetical protein